MQTRQYKVQNFEKLNICEYYGSVTPKNQMIVKEVWRQSLHRIRARYADRTGCRWMTVYTKHAANVGAASREQSLKNDWSRWSDRQRLPWIQARCDRCAYRREYILCYYHRACTLHLIMAPYPEDLYIGRAPGVLLFGWYYRAALLLSRFRVHQQERSGCPAGITRYRRTAYTEFILQKLKDPNVSKRIEELAARLITELVSNCRY